MTNRPKILTMQGTEQDNSAADPSDIFNYLHIKGDARIDAVNDRLEEREKTLWEIDMMLAMLEGNPEQGKHKEPKNEDDTCPCGKCEFKRLTKMRASMIYSISKLRALKGTLS